LSQVSTRPSDYRPPYIVHTWDWSCHDHKWSSSIWTTFRICHRTTKLVE